MARGHAGWLIVALCCGACSGGMATIPHCDWPDEPGARLDLQRRADRRHLGADVRRAEQMAIRYADLTRGHRSGHYQGPDEYHRTREQCFADLSGAIAGDHGIDRAQVVRAVGQRDERLDAIVLLAFAALYAFAADGFLRQLFLRFPPDEKGPALVGAAAGAIAMSATGVILGGLGATIVEMIHVGDTHLSYRAERLPWSQHWLPFYAGAVILFALIAALRWQIFIRRQFQIL
jgi:hypothetical protein